SGRGPFASAALRERFVPDAIVWWTGGQLGVVHVTSALWVATPLTFVSTWDGDELSLVQAHAQLRAARACDVAGTSLRLDEALAPLAAIGIDAGGLGLYRVIRAGDRSAELVLALAPHVSVRALPHGAIPIAPGLDHPADVRLLAEGIRRFCGR